MIPFFVDTSALAKRHVPEVGSAWVRSWIEPEAGNIVVVSDLARVELISILARRLRESAIEPQEFALLRGDFLLHVANQYLTVSIDDSVLTKADNLLVRHELRTLDAVQLACAMVATQTLGQSLTFVSSDRKLLAAASREGLPTDDPSAHP